GHEPLEAAGVEQAAVAEAAGRWRWRIAAEQHLGRAQHVPGLQRDQLLELERAPRGVDLIGLRIRIGHRRGEERGVDRTYTRPADDIDRDVPPEFLRETRADVVNDSGFVRTARPAAR